MRCHLLILWNHLTAPVWEYFIFEILTRMGRELPIHHLMKMTFDYFSDKLRINGWFEMTNEAIMTSTFFRKLFSLGHAKASSFKMK